MNVDSILTLLEIGHLDLNHCKYLFIHFEKSEKEEYELAR